VHLATAVNAGADRSITNNAKDVKHDIKEIDITYPNDLPPRSHPDQTTPGQPEPGATILALLAP